VKDCVRVQLRIKAELRFYNIPFPTIKGTWSKQFIENLHRLNFRDRWLKESFERLLSMYDCLRKEVDTQRRLIYELAQTERYREHVRLLRTIPGVGILTAMEFLVELQDVRRFGTGDKLAAYVGLTPSQHSSGQHVRMGRITRVGRGQLRALLVESSWMLIRKDPAMGAKYDALKCRIGGKKAIVAIAHKLLLRARRVVLDGTPYISGKAA
jgi:transposase